MATNDMGTTSRGIQYPTKATQFASADWWKRLADSVNTALGEAIKDSGWNRGVIPGSTNIDDVRTVGAYSISRLNPPIGTPFPGESVTLEVLPTGTTFVLQRVTTQDGRGKVRAGGGDTLWVWSEWSDVGGRETRNLLDSGTDLDELREIGVYTVSRSAPVTGHPFAAAPSGTVEVIPSGTRFVTQRITTQDGVVAYRSGGGNNQWVWYDWVIDGASGALSGALTHSAGEVTGKWPTVDDIYATCNSFAEHDRVTHTSIGKTVKGKDIPLLTVGDPSKPAVFMSGSLHGDEPSPPGALFRFVRELLEAESLVLMDLCFYIIPVVNMDSWGVKRANANGIDLNRDWVNFSQPETIALRDFIKSKNIIAAVDMHSFGYPRQISMRIPETASGDLKTKSQELYDSAYLAVVNSGNLAREYAVAGDASRMRNGLAALNIPGILVEVPALSLTDTVPKPTLAWGAYAGALALSAVAHTAWKWTSSYKSDQLPLIPNSVPGSDTGWRRIALPSGASGTLLVRRKGDAVHVQAANINGLTGYNTLVTLPAGMRPKLTAYFSMTGSAVLQVTAGGALQINSATAAGYHVGGLDYLADHQPFPASADYPGTAEN